MVLVLVYCNNSDPPSNKTNKAITSTPSDRNIKEQIRKRNAYSREFSSPSTHVQADAETSGNVFDLLSHGESNLRFLQ